MTWWWRLRLLAAFGAYSPVPYPPSRSPQVQRFFQVARDPDRVLFKALLQVGKDARQGLRFAFTGSGMVRAWIEIAQCPANGTTLTASSFPINLPATDSPAVLAYATERLLQHYKDFEDAGALRELLGHAPSVAGRSFLAKLWSETLSNERTVEEVSARASHKYWSEFRTDMLPLLTEMSTTDKRGGDSTLLRLRQLAEGTAREDPETWLPGYIYSDFFRFYIHRSVGDDGQPVYGFANTPFSALVRQHVDTSGRLLEPAPSNVLRY